MGDKWDISQQRALAAQKAKHLLGCITSSSREGMLPLCSALLTAPRSAAPALGSPAQGNGFELNDGGVRLDRGKECCTTRVVTWAQAAQSGCGCPIPGRAQGQVGRGWEQPGLGGGGPAHSRGVGLGGL